MSQTDPKVLTAAEAAAIIRLMKATVEGTAQMLATMSAADPTLDVAARLAARRYLDMLADAAGKQMETLAAELPAMAKGK